MICNKYPRLTLFELCVSELYAFVCCKSSCNEADDISRVLSDCYAF